MDANGDNKKNKMEISEKEKAAKQSNDPEKNAPKTLKYPKVVFFIIGNEFCERFSYYGMRTVLSLYLNKALGLSEANATIIYHVFAMFCYFFPVIGAIIADSWLGKFKTIAYLSVVYAAGNIIVSVASATGIGIPSLELTFVGLLLISIGTGGIKPCVSAFGGDQFVLPQQARQLASFFSVFYFSINAGSLISTFLTPELRERVQCLGQDSCYPLAFGVPAALMLVSLFVFVLGKPGYKIVKPKGNVLVEVSKCMTNAFSNKMKSKDKMDHWLDHADERFSEKLKSDIRAVLRVLLLFVPLPIFWALYDQQGSRWTFQATNMNGRMGSFTLKPDQMQVVNPLLILLFLPLFETVIYPILNKMRLLTKPLQKMATGGVIAAIAFIISGVLELQLQTHYPVPLSPGFAQVRVFNSLPCQITLNQTELPQMHAWTNTSVRAEGTAYISLQLVGDCLAPGSKLELSVEEERSTSYHLYTTDPSTQTVVSLKADKYDDLVEKNTNPWVRVMYSFPDDTSHNLTFHSGSGSIHPTTSPLKGASVLDDAVTLEAGKYTLTLDGVKVAADQLLDVGGVYTVLVDGPNVEVLTVITPNVIHIMWLLPQYIVITVAEIMFSVTGLEFAFTQAPVSMKSVLTSAWLLTVAFGNLIVVLITESRFFSSQASEFFLFAGLMLVVMVIFMWLAVRYTYVDIESSEDSEVEQSEQRQMDILSNGDVEKPDKA